MIRAAINIAALAALAAPLGCALPADIELSDREKLVVYARRAADRLEQLQPIRGWSMWVEPSIAPLRRAESISEDDERDLEEFAAHALSSTSIDRDAAQLADRVIRFALAVSGELLELEEAGQ